MHRLGAVLLAALMVMGCGSDSGPRSRSTTASTSTATAAPTYPVAYRIPKTVARTLPEADAYAEIERSGQVVADTRWEDYTALVLSAWLDEEHDIGVEAPAYGDVTSRLASEQELYLIVVTGEHADALRRLRPREGALRTYFDRFTEDGYPETGWRCSTGCGCSGVRPSTPTPATSSSSRCSTDRTGVPPIPHVWRRQAAVASLASLP